MATTAEVISRIKAGQDRRNLRMHLAYVEGRIEPGHWLCDWHGYCLGCAVARSMRFPNYKPTYIEAQIAKLRADLDELEMLLKEERP